jgi:transposase InsO family protein
LWKDLREDGEAVSEKRVRRLMHEEQIQGRIPKRFKQTTNSDHQDPIAANVLDRAFTAAAPNQRWVSDTTEFVIGESAKLYLAAILDLYSRFVVGWAVSAVNDRRLTLQALEMAVRRRCPEPGLLHHSDRGCTYTCEDYQRYLASHGITCSMSRRADCYDNAVMESFFATVKKEEADRFSSYSEAKMALFDYIEVFYNQRRRHSTLGQISPAEFEKRAARRVDPVENCKERSFPPAPHASSLLSGKERRTKGDQLTATVHSNGSGPGGERGSHQSQAHSRPLR